MCVSEEGFSTTRILRVCRPAKCAEYFWPAVFQVLDACPEAELTIVGGAAYAAGRVQSLGYRLDVEEIASQSDIFAYTPRPREGAFDLVVLEMMASGMPCVLSDVPCVNEAVQHGVTGFLTPYEDVSAFAASLQCLVQDRAMRDAMGRQAAVVAYERFEVRDRTPLYSAAYQRALDEDILHTQGQGWHQKFLEWLVHG
jgi:glycosyltransferase involved in cell wall biosynthesis